METTNGNKNGHAASGTRYCFDEFEIDPANRILLRDGKPVPLTGKVFDILLVFAENPGRLLEKDELLEKVWHSEFVEEGNLARNVSTLRKALGDEGKERKYITTVQGRGYRFLADVEVGDVAREIPETPALGAAWYRGRPVLIAIPLVLLAVLAFSWYLQRPGYWSQPEIKSLAVLPLDNLSGDPSQEYFADGMTETLITDIAKLGDFQVISRGSVMRYKNSDIPIPEISRQLGVDGVITGSVMRVGDRARITVQLIHAATDRHLWAETYERDLRDVLALQRDIALSVGRQISARAVGQQRVGAPKRQIEPDAYEAYLKGLYYSNKRTPESQTKALDYYLEAVRLSPFYPEAHASLAMCYIALGGWYAVKDRDESLEKARVGVAEALQQDEGLAEAHVALGYLKQEYEWDWAAAEREFRRAIELNPSYAAAHRALARQLLLVGRLDEVPAEVERARSADPLSLSDVGVGAWILDKSGHHQQAVDRMKAVVQMDPNIPVTQFLFGLVYMDGGELDLAVDQFRTAIGLYPSFGKFKAHLAFVLARSGDKQEARKVLDELLRSRNIVSFDVGLVMAGLGEEEQAIDWLEKAYQERSIEMIYLRVLATPGAYERPFYFLRNNPRFKELLRRMNYSEP